MATVHFAGYQHLQRAIRLVNEWPEYQSKRWIFSGYFTRMIPALAEAKTGIIHLEVHYHWV